MKEGERSCSAARAAAPSYEWSNGIGHSMAQVMIALRREVDSRMAALGLTEAQWKPLWMLSTGRAGTAFEMSREMCVDAGALTRTLDRLAAKGLVERTRSETDRRVVHLRLTSTGEAAAAQIPLVLASVNADLLKGFSQQDIQHLGSLLERLALNLQSIQHTSTGVS